MRKGPVVLALLMIGGIYFQVRGNNQMQTDSRSPGYLTRTSAEQKVAEKSVERLIAAWPTAGKPAASPLLVSQIQQAKRHRVVLSWSPSLPITIKGEDLISGYNVYRRREVGTVFSRYIKINSDLVTETDYVDDSVQSGFSYDYQTTAVNYRGAESRPSNQIRVRIPYP